MLLKSRDICIIPCGSSGILYNLYLYGSHLSNLKMFNKIFQFRKEQKNLHQLLTYINSVYFSFLSNIFFFNLDQFLTSYELDKTVKCNFFGMFSDYVYKRRNSFLVYRKSPGTIKIWKRFANLTLLILISMMVYLYI